MEGGTKIAGCKTNSIDLDVDKGTGGMSYVYVVYACPLLLFPFMMKKVTRTTGVMDSHEQQPFGF